MRIQRFLAQAGVASRRHAEDMVRQGKVRVNGAVVTELGTRIDERKDRVEVDGRRVWAEAPLYRAILKPRQCLATLQRPSQRPTLARFVPERELGWKVVAPLDFLAEGVVLLTTDGALAERMSRGGGKVPMTYHLKFQGVVAERELSRLRRGWTWLGRTVRPVAVGLLATTGKNTWIEMTVAESRPRVLKAAQDAVHRSLLKISRVRLGPVSFEGLAMGGFRDLTASEVEALRDAAGQA